MVVLSDVFVLLTRYWSHFYFCKKLYFVEKIEKENPFFPSLLNFAAAGWRPRCCLIETVIMIRLKESSLCFHLWTVFYIFWLHMRLISSDDLLIFIIPYDKELASSCVLNLTEQIPALVCKSLHMRRGIILHSNTHCCTDIMKKVQIWLAQQTRSNLINAVSLVVSSCLVGKETARVNAVKESTCSSWGNLHNRILREAKLHRL